LRKHIGSSGPETADVEALKQEVVDLRLKVEKLNEENADLRQQASFFIYLLAG
jgi:cell division protein FtsB